MQPDPGELQALVRDLHQQRSAWLPSGLGSRLDWGAPVREGCSVLSTARLNRIVEHCSGDFTITVEAGLPLRDLQEHLQRQRQWLALDWPWGGDDGCAGSVGGLVARGMAGGYRQRYLGVRDQVIGLRILRADGVLAQAGGRVVKNVAGYDLMRLFTGSWGSLGLITELTLRTMPLPPCRRGLLVWGPPAGLADLCSRLLASSLTPERIDAWSSGLAGAVAPTLNGAAGDGEAALLVALASVDALALEDQLSWLQQQSPLPSRRLEPDDLAALLEARRRHGCTEPGASGTAAWSWLLRLGSKPDRCAELLAAPPFADVPLELAAGSGLGLAWATAAQLTSAQVVELRQFCRRLGGELTVLRQPTEGDLPAWDDAPSRPLIEAVKQAFDPLGQLAPGRLPGVAPSAAQAAARQASSSR